MSSEPRQSIHWVLNLDAEAELAASGPYQPRKAMQAIVRIKQQSLLDRLVRAGDHVLGSETPDVATASPWALAWCPTPWAIERARVAGKTPLGVIPFEVIRRVNHKGFALGCRASLSGSFFEKTLCESEAQVQACMSAVSEGGWLLRRPFGAAGRGRLHVAGSQWTAHERKWLRASLDGGQVLVEPWVRVLWEVSTCGWIDGAGTTHLAEPRMQTYNRQGAWNAAGAHAATALEATHRTELRYAAEQAGAALVGAGYRGPFGVDAFAYTEPGGELRLNPIGEINARFTMAWPDSFVQLLDGGLVGPHGELPW